MSLEKWFEELASRRYSTLVWAWYRGNVGIKLMLISEEKCKSRPIFEIILKISVLSIGTLLHTYVTAILSGTNIFKISLSPTAMVTVVFWKWYIFHKVPYDFIYVIKGIEDSSKSCFKWVAIIDNKDAVYTKF